jgi:anti-sigma factor RsiW
MSVDTELLMAYVDGELSPAQAAQVEAAMAADPAVADAVARQFALRRSLGEAYAPVLDEPMPEALTRMLRPSNAEPGNVVTLPPRAAPAPRPRWGVPQWAAMAASLLLGVAVSQWVSKPDAALVRTEGGALVAGAELASSLEQQLASSPQPGAAVAVGLTFRDAAGHYCRSFSVEGSQPLAGLACRESGGDWKVPMIVESTAQAGELRQASTAIPAAVLAEATARMSGDPLDAAEERKARDAGWR